ncbi:hypothetical protein P7V44_07565 [Providencia sp. CRE-3FA-0001]|uniref:DUF4412 domain-containing protein n=6 Tax=Enterobacterales TaxID=91347 RepID=Q8KK19_PROVU|nr:MULTISPECIES: hypothetical protein [Enterobacterales]ELB1214896.1 hypothetical protein [Proteus mirabilis]ELY4881538.1 hypothetical protein [Morganella morganii]SPY66499.1 Uncharacterised protein [Providencia stuartii]HAZ7869362.1 hypothetical protein [Escherichia coli]ELR5243186.1 hypothetical protein [Providencia rettgeri]
MKNHLSALRCAVLLAMPLIAFPALSAQQDTHPVDVRAFDVGGVKTGMSIEEARTAMAKNFGASSSAITESKSLPSQVTTLITGTEQIMFLVYDNNGTRMQVSFEPRVPYDKNNPMAVSQISYELPWSKDNEKAMNDAALKKYGPVSQNNMNPLWCDKPLPGTGMGCASDSATLEVSGTKLRMYDPAWTNARIKFMEEKNATKPQF